jgi:hypothetical protein
MSSDVTEFSVLFYKRSLQFKVHKSKGVSKVDGVLTIHKGTKTACLRCTENDEDNDSSDDEGQKMTWKERRKKTAKSALKGVVYSGKLPGGDVSKIETDCTIILGSYEVEIIAEIATSATRGPSSKTQTGHTDTKRTTVVPLRSSLPTTKKTVLPVKRKQLGTRPFSQSSSVLLKRQPPPPPQLTNAKRPARVLRKVDNTTHKEDTTYAKVAANRTTAASTKPFHTNNNTIRPKISTFRPPTVAAMGPAILPHIPLPGGIRNALRPHQQEGVDFIWRALSDNKGCLLADEMGL